MRHGRIVVIVVVVVFVAGGCCELLQDKLTLIRKSLLPEFLNETFSEESYCSTQVHERLWLYQTSVGRTFASS